MITDNDFRIVRIRMKGPDEQDHSKIAWRKNQVGVWYGAWLPEQLDMAIDKYDNSGKHAAKEYMTDISKNEPGWAEYPIGFLHTCRRFRDIEEKKDWIVVCFYEKLCLGQLEGSIEIDKSHEEGLMN